MVEPRSVMWKYRSSQDEVLGEDEDDEDFVGVGVLTAAFFQIITRGAKPADTRNFLHR